MSAARASHRGEPRSCQNQRQTGAKVGINSTLNRYVIAVRRISQYATLRNDRVIKGLNNGGTEHRQ